MNHDSACHAHNILDSILCHAILMVTSNSTQMNTLLVLGQLIQEIFGGINAIVSTVGFHSDSCAQHLTFKVELACNSIGGRQRDLVVH